MLHRVAAPALLVALLASDPAHGQPITGNQTGISVDRLVTPPGPGTILSAEDAEVLGSRDWSLGVVGSLMSRPLVFYDLAGGTSVSVPVRLRLGYELLAAVGLGGRCQLGIGLPFVAAQDGDRLQGIDLDESPLAPIALGDLRLHAKLHLAGEPGRAGGSAAVTMMVQTPTGNQDHFAGEQGTVVEWRLIGGWRWHQRGVAVLDVGPRLRTQEVVLLSPSRRHGNELVGAIAGELIVPGLARDPLSALLEYGFAVGDSSHGIRGPSPQELRLGGRWRFADGVVVTAAAGFGTSPDQVGSPAWRMVLGVRFDSGPLGDLDRDGYLDREDRCRGRAEDFDGFDDFDGCPEPDNDGDGISDHEDLCPNRAEDFDRHRDLDGCPDP